MNVNLFKFKIGTFSENEFLNLKKIFGFCSVLNFRRGKKKIEDVWEIFFYLVNYTFYH